MKNMQDTAKLDNWTVHNNTYEKKNTREKVNNNVNNFFCEIKDKKKFNLKKGHFCINPC